MPVRRRLDCRGRRVHRVRHAQRRERPVCPAQQRRHFHARLQRASRRQQLPEAQRRDRQGAGPLRFARFWFSDAAGNVVDVLTSGEPVTAKFIPARNGSPLGFLKSITRADGTVMSISAGNPVD